MVLALFSLFLLSFIGLFITGFDQYNQEQVTHHQSTISFWEYFLTPHFIEAIFENWESEFLQMWALVMLTIFLRQKGSADSKKLKGHEDVDASSRYSIIRSFKQRKNRTKAFSQFLYSHSLGIALLTFFIISFVLHGISGGELYNEEARTHGEEQIPLLQYFISSQFWFESFQNWQSEFLSVASLLLLTIFLRERGSPESKPIGKPNTKTGE